MRNAVKKHWTVVVAVLVGGVFLAGDSAGAIAAITNKDVPSGAVFVLSLVMVAGTALFELNRVDREIEKLRVQTDSIGTAMAYLDLHPGSWEWLQANVSAMATGQVQADRVPSDLLKVGAVESVAHNYEYTHFTTGIKTAKIAHFVRLSQRGADMIARRAGQHPPP